VFIGFLWCVLGIIGSKLRESIPFVKICVISFIFSIGLIYGAFLNIFILPFYIYCFFFSISFLQLSRELTKGFNEREKKEEYFPFPVRIDNEKLLKFSLLFQILALFFLSISIVFTFMYPTLFLFIALPGLIIMILASFLTLASILENHTYTKISSILKIVIFIELIVLLMVGK
jgi:4-hydroxybenzoate polyprenyltransferase